MMGMSNSQPAMFHHINLEQFVTADHPMWKIRPASTPINIERHGPNPVALRPLYADIGQLSIPPE